MNARTDLELAAQAPRPTDRKQFIGGSDAAAILGVSPWHTPLDLYLIKTGQKAEHVDAARARLFKRGKRREPEVIDDVIELYGVKVTKRSTPENPNRYVDADRPYIAAEIDFEFEVTVEIAEEYRLPASLVGTIQNGEVKTVHPFASAKFGEEGTDEIPVEYAAQAMHGLMVTGRKLTLFAVGVDANDPLLYWIHRDDDTIAAMLEKEEQFWHGHVLAGIPPQPVNLPDVLELFNRKKIASRITASPEVAALVPELHKARDMAKVYVERADDLRFEIGKFIVGDENVSKDKDGTVVPGAAVPEGEHHLLVDGAVILRLVKQTQGKLDAAAVREKFPDAAAECTKSISFFKFSKPLKPKGRKK